MERLVDRLETARKALKTLKSVAGHKRPSLEKRDAAIQRFEYTFEAVWKAIQHYLAEEEGLSIASPKGCIRASREVGLLNDAESVLALQMTDDRNLTSHTYNEGIAKKIYRVLVPYCELLEKWLDATERRYGASGAYHGQND